MTEVSRGLVRSKFWCCRAIGGKATRSAGEYALESFVVPVSPLGRYDVPILSRRFRAYHHARYVLDSRSIKTKTGEAHCDRIHLIPGLHQDSKSAGNHPRSSPGRCRTIRSSPRVPGAPLRRGSSFMAAECSGLTAQRFERRQNQPRQYGNREETRAHHWCRDRAAKETGA